MADWLIPDEPDPLDWPAPAPAPTPEPAPAPAPAPEREAPTLKDLVALVRAELGLGPGVAPRQVVAEVEEFLGVPPPHSASGLRSQIEWAVGELLGRARAEELGCSSSPVVVQEADVADENLKSAAAAAAAAPPKQPDVVDAPKPAAAASAAPAK